MRGRQKDSNRASPWKVATPGVCEAPCPYDPQRSTVVACDLRHPYDPQKFQQILPTRRFDSSNGQMSNVRFVQRNETNMWSTIAESNWQLERCWLDVLNTPHEDMSLLPPCGFHTLCFRFDAAHVVNGDSWNRGVAARPPPSVAMKRRRSWHPTGIGGPPSVMSTVREFLQCAQCRCYLPVPAGTRRDGGYLGKQRSRALVQKMQQVTSSGEE